MGEVCGQPDGSRCLRHRDGGHNGRRCNVPGHGLPDEVRGLHESLRRGAGPPRRKRRGRRHHSSHGRRDPETGEDRAPAALHRTSSEIYGSDSGQGFGGERDRTASTYAPIIATFEREYIARDQRRLHATELGITVDRLLTENFLPSLTLLYGGMEKASTP